MVVCCWFLIWRWRVLDKKPPPFLSLVFLKPKRLCLWTLFVSFIDDDNVVFYIFYQTQTAKIHLPAAEF